MADDVHALPAARVLPRRDYLALKAACRRLVDICGGPSAAAKVCGTSQSRISEAISPDYPDRFLRIDQVADLECECGRSEVTVVLANLMHSEIVPQAVMSETRSLSALLAAVVKESGSLAGDAAVALAAGEVKPNDLIAIKASIEHTMSALRELEQKISGL